MVKILLLLVSRVLVKMALINNMPVGWSFLSSPVTNCRVCSLRLVASTPGLACSSSTTALRSYKL